MRRPRSSRLASASSAGPSRPDIPSGLDAFAFRSARSRSRPTEAWARRVAAGGLRHRHFAGWFAERDRGKASQRGGRMCSCCKLPGAGGTRQQGRESSWQSATMEQNERPVAQKGEAAASSTRPARNIASQGRPILARALWTIRRTNCGRRRRWPRRTGAVGAASCQRATHHSSTIPGSSYDQSVAGA